MGNTDSIPVVSQMKSLTQYTFGDATAARATQNNFLYNNTFPVTSQLTSLGYVIAGDNDKALDLQKKFADDMTRIIDSIPVAGHIKGGVHYALGENEEGDNAMKAASRSTAVAVGGVGGFVAGGPFGAVAGGIAGGATMDGIITGSEILLKKDKAQAYGYVAMGENIADAVEKRSNISVEQGFDLAMMPVGDGIAGYAAGRGIGKPLINGAASQAKGQGNVWPVVAKGEVASGSVSAARNAASTGKVLKPVAIAQKVAVEAVDGDNAVVVRQFKGLDKLALDNRANQLNPNHAPSGPGRAAGYKGLATKADLDNHANQLNPNNPLYRTG